MKTNKYVFFRMWRPNHRLKLTAPLTFAQWARSLTGALGIIHNILRSIIHCNRSDIRCIDGSSP
jgi:hypothetical protein